jgi:hypothetical protein
MNWFGTFFLIENLLYIRTIIFLLTGLSFLFSYVLFSI